MVLDRIGHRLTATDRAHGDAVQQRRARVGLRLGTCTAIHRGGVGDVGRRREAALHLHPTERGTVLPAVAVTVVEHRAEHQAVVQQRIGRQHHFGRGHVGYRIVGGRAHLGLVDVGARTYAGAHAHHVDQGRSLACRHVHPAEAQGVAAGHRGHGIGIVGQQGAFHVAEARRRRVHHAAVDHVHAAHVLHRQGVAHQIADADFAAACRLAQADLRCFQFMLRAAGGAGRQLAAPTGGAHLVAHHRAGVRVHDRLVGQRVHAGRRTGRQLAGQPCAVEGAAGGQRAQGQAAIGCIDQDQGLAQGRCTDLHRERVAHRLAHLHLGTGARVGGLGDHDTGRGNRRLRGAGAGTGGCIITGTDHGVVHRAHGLVIDRGRVGHRVGARHGAHRQRAHQRVAAIAGVRTGIGHRTEGQARAQRVGQHHVAGGDRVDHRGGQRVGDGVTHAGIGLA